jgi:hypothetical protein
MQNSLISPLVPAIPQSQAVLNGNAPVGTEEDASRFTEILESVFSGISSHAPTPGCVAIEPTSEVPNLVSLLPATVEAGMPCLLHQLTDKHGLSVDAEVLRTVTPGEGTSEAEASNETTGITSILPVVLSAAILVFKANGPNSGSGSVNTTISTTPIDSPEEDTVDSGMDVVPDAELFAGGENVLEMLAVLLFNALQTASNNPAAYLGRGRVSDADKRSADISPDLGVGNAATNNNPGNLLENMIEKLQSAIAGTRKNGTTGYSGAGNALAMAKDQEGQSVSFMVKNLTKANLLSQSEGAVELPAGGMAVDNPKGTNSGQPADGMLSRTLLFIGEELESSSSQESAGERKQQKPEHHAFPGADQTISDRPSGQQKSPTVAHPTSLAAVERFEKIVEQVSGKSSSQNLTVKLDIGNDENVVLGLRDLGRTVTVEVRASHQGLISLLQSQKDAIIRHLEGKDVRTNIFIDPNASGTPERRDGRESKRRVLKAIRHDDTVFGTFLETFA